MPPSCVNRDDTGRPKTAIYGGATRARISSQCWKHAMRERFKEMCAEDNLGYRTRQVEALIADELKKHDFNHEQASKKATEIVKKVNTGKKVITSNILFFISDLQIKKLVELHLSGEKDKNAYIKVLKENPSIDIALFGRMVADDASLNVDASSQVAHSISTHAIQNEYDYFTAVDDYSNEDSSGAGHLGTMEFNSSTMYRYATINVTDLAKQIDSDVAQAVKDFIDAFIYAMPTGKQNSYANRTLPSMIYVTLREDMPVNLCGAFEKPIYSTDGYVEKSIQALYEHAKKTYEDYCGKPTYSFVVGTNTFAVDTDTDLGAQKVTTNELLEKVYESIKEVI